MKGISTIVIILGIILILGLIFVSSNLHLPRACTKEAKRCPDGSYVFRDSYNNCEFRPCPSGTTSTTIIPAKSIDLDELIIDTAKYVNSYVNVRGYVVKNVGAFFGETYFLQSFFGIQNFKSLSESSTGIALIGNYDFESIVSYTFDGRSYNSLNPEIVAVYGTIKDRGSPPPTDVSRYYFEVQKVTSTIIICEEGSRRCLGNGVEECINGQWAALTTFCKYGCSNGKCNSEPIVNISCNVDFDCPSQMKCENLMCIDVGCVGEGSMTPGPISPEYRKHMATECCEGLKLIMYSGYFDENCKPTGLAGAGNVCSKCGNSVCEKWETKCTCSEDCN